MPPEKIPNLIPPKAGHNVPGLWCRPPKGGLAGLHLAPSRPRTPQEPEPGKGGRAIAHTALTIKDMPLLHHRNEHT